MLYDESMAIDAPYPLEYVEESTARSGVICDNAPDMAAEYIYSQSNFSRPMRFATTTRDFRRVEKGEVVPLVSKPVTLRPNFWTRPSDD